MVQPKEGFDHPPLRKNESWKTQNREIKADYAPIEDVEIKSFYNKNVIAKPFQIIEESKENKACTNKELKSIQIQNNYSNGILSSIAT